VRYSGTYPFYQEFLRAAERPHRRKTAGPVRPPSLPQAINISRALGCRFLRTSSPLSEQKSSRKRKNLSLHLRAGELTGSPPAKISLSRLGGSALPRSSGSLHSCGILIDPLVQVIWRPRLRFRGVGRTSGEIETANTRAHKVLEGNVKKQLVVASPYWAPKKKSSKNRLENLAKVRYL